MEIINTQLEDLFNAMGFSEEEEQEVSAYSFSSEGEVDDAIESFQNLEADETRFENLYKEKKAKLDFELECKKLAIGKKKDWILFNLKNSVLQSTDSKETKTQIKKSYFAGDIVITKSKTNLLKPELTEETILKDFPKFANTKTVTTLNWAELKKELKVVDGAVIFVKTGVDLSTTISTEITAEKVSVK